jgi:hypothetical protein
VFINKIASMSDSNYDSDSNLQLENNLKIFASWILRKLDQICKTGARGRIPTTEEIDKQRVRFIFSIL